jgi:hypothetical protein
MIAVSISQFFSSWLFVSGEKWGFLKTGITLKTFRNFFFALFFAGVTTLLIYMPILPTFFKNMGKVQLVEVNRMPFILSLLNSLFPGFQNFLGSIIYSALFFSGIYCILRKDRILFLYLLVLSVLPVSLYLMINPMFVFERYFIFVLPFTLLVVSQGVVGIAENFKGIYKYGFVLLPITIILYLHIPAIDRVLHQDRQNYREAVRYVVGEIQDSEDDLVFAIGYAGEHFRY